ncbi:MAG: tRNA pseudouridine(55) synthase TruB [Treponema sp.]|nr:tRNA pseudouridine(55) synthase TruB [Treponema sp.]
MKAGKTDPGGLLLLHKNPGLTSFESLGIVKKNLGTGKVGHTGTLDKFAGGLLLVLAGKALKLTSLFSYCKKVYEGVILFGTETDTLDPEGKITTNGKFPSRDEVEAALNLFRGDIMQAPPAFSAIHIDGKRAYELSRQGKPPEMQKRPVTIYSLELISWDPPYAGIQVVCSAGTYIRSLARDIAQAAGSCAHLSALRRTAIGNFLLEDAIDGEKADREDLIKAVRPITVQIFRTLELPAVYANEEQTASLVCGQPLDGSLLKNLVSGLQEAPAAGIFVENDKLIAVLEQKNGHWAYGHVFQ